MDFGPPDHLKTADGYITAAIRGVMAARASGNLTLPSSPRHKPSTRRNSRSLLVHQLLAFGASIRRCDPQIIVADSPDRPAPVRRESRRNAGLPAQ